MSPRPAPSRRVFALPAVLLLALVTGCTGATDNTGTGPTPAPSSTPPTSADPTSSSSLPTTSTAPSKTASTRPRSSPQQAPASFDVDRAMRTVRFLALRVGPREAASPAYDRAADWVEHRLTAEGYDVTRPRVVVPAGSSWGVDVDAGTTTNVVAVPPGFDAGRPHLVVSAHLDTVPQAPGAEDDASGIGVLLELARLAASGETRLPLVFVAFGGEEPRGDGDALHHFGSRAMVATMSQAQRDAVVAMVSMDRVGVGSVVPVCTAGRLPPMVRSQLLRAAARAHIPTLSCVNASSDHWSFEEVGIPAARVGGTSFAGYHSAADLPAVINPPQLRRVGHLLGKWMQQR